MQILMLDLSRLGIESFLEKSANVEGVNSTSSTLSVNQIELRILTNMTH